MTIDINYLTTKQITADMFFLNNSYSYLRSHQHDALKLIQKGIKNGRKTFLLQMAVGTGKTALGLILSAFFLECGANRILYLSSMKVMEEYLYNMVSKELASIRTVIMDDSSDWVNSQFVISTYHKVLKYKDSFNEDDFDLIVCDELDSLSIDINDFIKTFNSYKLGFKQSGAATYFDSKADVLFKYTLEDAINDNTLISLYQENKPSSLEIDIFDEIKQKLMGIKETLSVDIKDIKNISELSASLDVINDALQEHKEVFSEYMKKTINKSDISTLVYRKQQIEEFRRILYDDEYFKDIKARHGNSAERMWQLFFEKNKWIFGYGLNYFFNSSLDEKNFEQVLYGSNFLESGKRIDAILKTSGMINSLCFVELKTHLTPLLSNQYRNECWAISKEFAGEISQIQNYKYKSMKSLSNKILMKTKDGDPTGEIIFNYTPKSILIIGDLKQFVSDNGVNEDKYASFDIFRKNIEGIEIITFDELFERARYIVEN